MKTFLLLVIVVVFSLPVIAFAETAVDVKGLPQEILVDVLESYEFELDLDDRKFLIESIQKMPEEKQAILSPALNALENVDSDVDLSSFSSLLNLDDSLAICSRLADHKDPMLRFFANYFMAKRGDTNAAKRIHDLIHSEKPSLLQKQVIKSYCQLMGIRAELNSPEKIAEYFTSMVIKAPKLKPGDAAPAFKVTDTNGQELSLEKLEGKVVLLHFWATWCGPCMGQMESLKADLAKYSPEDVAIVFISLDYDQEAFDDAVTELELPGFNVLSNAGIGGDLPKAYAVNGIPFDIIIDSNKKVISNDIRDITGLLQQPTITK